MDIWCQKGWGCPLQEWNCWELPFQLHMCTLLMSRHPWIPCLEEVNADLEIKGFWHKTFLNYFQPTQDRFSFLTNKKCYNRKILHKRLFLSTSLFSFILVKVAFPALQVILKFWIFNVVVVALFPSCQTSFTSSL